ncbi:MAG TPA: hypothetical protein VHR72_08735 [Gemmataceae bacterium]|jgi:hypothetical protein|nr:hypothetical protein [Gemmataceae bacterium]
MLKVLGALVVLVAIAGIVSYSQGWLTFTAQDGDRTKIKVEFDKSKAKEEIKEDLNKAGEAVHKAGSNVMEAIKPKK